ncbi:hypothetical protein RI054_37g141230 [Pseudoscourfieldia marina]
MVRGNRSGPPSAPVPGAPNSQSGLNNPGAAAAAAAAPPDLGAVHQQLAALQAQLNLLTQAPAPQQPPPHLAFDETSRLLFLSEAALRQHFNVAPADPLPPHIQLTSFPSRDAALAAHPDLVDRTAPPPPPPNPNPPLPQPYLPPPPDPNQQAPPFPAVQGGATSFVTDEAYNANVTFSVKDKRAYRKVYHTHGRANTRKQTLPAYANNATLTQTCICTHTYTLKK